MELNPDQMEAVEHVDGPCLIVACPGSGKTRVITERIGCLIEKGVAATSLLSITFTNKAAKEMHERVEKRIGEVKLGFLGTIHGFCAYTLRQYGELLGYGKFLIYDAEDQLAALTRILKKRSITLGLKDKKMLAGAINDYRENLLDDREILSKWLYEDEALLGVADEYLSSLKARNIIDFSGLLSETVRLLWEHPDVLRRLQYKYKYVQIDEVQDTNHAQFVLVDLLTKQSGNLFFVGDMDQSIYAFRGAKPKNITDYLEEHPECRVVTLSKNYRSTPQIVEAADTLIKKNSDRISHGFVPILPSGKQVEARRFLASPIEARWVAHTINKLREEESLSEIAVLYRVKSIAAVIEQALKMLNIPYKVIGDVSYYQRKEIKDMLAFVKLYANPKDIGAFERVAKILPGIGDVTVAKIDKTSLDDDVDYAEACRRFLIGKKNCERTESIEKIIKALSLPNPTIQDIIRYAYEQTDYSEQMKYQWRKKKHEKSTATGAQSLTEKQDNIKELMNRAVQYDAMEAGIQQFLEMTALMSAADEEGEEDSASLMTIHAAKGLEFGVVFIVGCEDGILPHGMALNESGRDGLEEERRVAYVGMTRAKKRLFLSYCAEPRMYREDGVARASRFLEEAEVKLVGPQHPPTPRNDVVLRRRNDY
jgi:DNA helicase-2/ATP-dependent DNA helicase PcrA